MTEPTPEQTAAAQRKGLDVHHAARLRGTTAEELDADADAFLAEIATFAPPPPAPPRSGGPRGGDVDGHGSGSVAAGAELYRSRNPRDEDNEAKRPARPWWRANGYRFEGGR
ncbi:hypothetical protein OG539_16420 [Actinacidiphila glaucinigra]|uniref:hypothetical protein n=1 Tax=Actinacidiphila glaucinigra TaxID=235986 RepID=UPI003255631B